LREKNDEIMKREIDEELEKQAQMVRDHNNYTHLKML
jgi:hypothetical protein